MKKKKKNKSSGIDVDVLSTLFCTAFGIYAYACTDNRTASIDTIRNSADGRRENSRTVGIFNVETAVTGIRQEVPGLSTYLAQFRVYMTE